MQRSAQLDRRVAAGESITDVLRAEHRQRMEERIAQISSQISQLQQELANLSGELVEAQGKATHAHSQFTAAAQRRAIEIEQQKAQYASLLKG